MRQTRGTWISAAVVGAVVAGGLFVATAAAAGRAAKVGEESEAVVETRELPGAGGTGGAEVTAETPGPRESGGAAWTPDAVVSHEVGQSPEEVLEYWSPGRMEQAEPMPMPTVVQRLSGD